MSQNTRGNQNFRPNNQQRRTSYAAGENNVQKIRLKRNFNKQAIIKQNLSHMEQQAEKKRLAQELYYSTKAGQSPLTRLNAARNSQNKPPVRNRLGNQLRLKRNGSQKMVNQPQRMGMQVRLQRVRPQQGQTTVRRNEKIAKIFTAQNRLSKIRQGSGNMVQRNVMQRGNAQRGAVQRGVLQRGIVQHVLLPSGANVKQKIRLRRYRQQNGGAVNYTVQVANSNVRNRNNVKHHVGSQLNRALQEEIRMIQHKSVAQDIPSLPIYPSGMGVTSRSLHERFSEL